MAAALLLCSVGCASIPPGARSPQAPLRSAHFVVEGERVPLSVRRDVLLAAQAARGDLAVWGDLREAVLIVVHPTHEELEQAVGRHGLPWLRAWAQFDRIDLQSPATFGHQDYRAPLRELLSHELTHVLMYQRIGGPGSWHQIYVPFWLREGMASWTARQGYRRGTPATLGRRLATHPADVDPLLDGEALTRSDQPLAYGAAHWAFDQLVVEVGEEELLALLDDLRREHDACYTRASASATAPAAAAPPTCGEGAAIFAAAFARRVGESEAAFAARFRGRLVAAANPGAPRAALTTARG